MRRAAVLLGLGAALVATEIGLRIHHAARGTYEIGETARRAASSSPWRASDDPEIVFEHRRDEGVRQMLRGDIESHGILQRREVTVAKAPGLLRIAVIGDSVGAAMNVPPADRIPAHLEARLAAETAKPVEVLNFCVMGYDTVQEARVLETRVAEFSPDAVILLYCLNDPGRSETPLTWFRPPEPPPLYIADAVKTVIFRTTGRSFGRPWVTAKGPADAQARIRWDEMYEPGGDGLAAVGHGFDRIAAWSKAKGVPVLVAIAPLLQREDPSGATTAGYRAQVADAAKLRGLPCVDLQPAFDGIRWETLVWQQDDVYHAAAPGLAALANRLYPAVREMIGTLPAFDAQRK